MIEALGYLWLRPWALLLVPVAAALGWILVRRAGRLGGWEQAADPELLAAMRRMGRVVPGTATRNWAPALVLGALGVALAGPATDSREEASYRNLDAVILVLDLSPSVTAEGRLFETLTAARLVAQSAGTRQVAVVVYGGEAFVAAPLSTDRQAVQGMLALIDAQTMPVAGSRPVAGLTLARTMLADAEILAADVVLISDGGNLGPDTVAQAQALARSGADVSAILVPGEPGGRGRLDALARTGGGVFGTLADPFAVAARIAARPADRLAQTGYAMLVLEDLGRYLLLLALLPAVLLLPRRGRA